MSRDLSRHQEASAKEGRRRTLAVLFAAKSRDFLAASSPFQLELGLGTAAQRLAGSVAARGSGLLTGTLDAGRRLGTFAHASQAPYLSCNCSRSLWSGASACNPNTTTPLTPLAPIAPFLARFFAPAGRRLVATVKDRSTGAIRRPWSAYFNAPSPRSPGRGPERSEGVRGLLFRTLLAPDGAKDQIPQRMRSVFCIPVQRLPLAQERGQCCQALCLVRHAPSNTTTDPRERIGGL